MAKGIGTLRETVHALLRKDARVSRFRTGRPERGRLGSDDCLAGNRAIKKRSRKRSALFTFYVRRLLSRWENNCIDHVNDSIAGCYVGFDNIGILDGHARIGYHNRSRFAIDGGHFTRRHVCSHDLGRDNMEGEDRDQHILVLRKQQALHSAFGKRSECLIGRCEDRERAVAFQGFNEFGSFYSGYERVETSSGNGSVDNIRLRAMTRCDVPWMRLDARCKNG